MNEKEQIDVGKMMSKLLMEAVREEIDNDMLNAIKDPNYVVQSTPVTFESEEDKVKFREHFKKVWDERNDFLKNEEDE